MIEHGYFRSKYNSYAYHQKLNDGSFVYLLLYEILVVPKDMCEVDKLKTLLKQEFEMKDLRAVKKILGMKSHRNRREEKSCLSQKKQIEKVLERFCMLDAKPVKTPLAAYFWLLSSQIDEEKKYMYRVSYASAIGSIIYAMVCTRPNISRATNVVRRYMDKLGKSHWHALPYLK